MHDAPYKAAISVRPSERENTTHYLACSLASSVATVVVTREDSFAHLQKKGKKKHIGVVSGCVDCLGRRQGGSLPEIKVTREKGIARNAGAARGTAHAQVSSALSEIAVSSGKKEI